MAKIKCSGCNNKGLFPHCHICFKRGQLTKDQFVEQEVPKIVEAERVNNLTQLERMEEDRIKEIKRHRYLGNVKDLKKMLASTMRSRKLLTGKAELDAIIQNILSEVIDTIHYEIDMEILSTPAEVVARFNVLMPTKEPVCGSW